MTNVQTVPTRRIVGTPRPLDHRAFVEVSMRLKVRGGVEPIIRWAHPEGLSVADLGEIGVRLIALGGSFLEFAAEDQSRATSAPGVNTFQPSAGSVVDAVEAAYERGGRSHGC